MSSKMESISARIKELEEELRREIQGKELEFCYKLRHGRTIFTSAAKSRNKGLRQSIKGYITQSRLLVFLTAPFIWLGLIPIFLIDMVGSLYQWICFPIYGIPKAPRREYIAFDRHRLGYLNIIEKINCEYCAYANGVLAYFTEVAARTEQHWCPIKHAGCVKCAHSRYKTFVDYGEAASYRADIEAIRRSFEDLVVPATATNDPEGIGRD
jgi:hypothetical protein